MLAHTSHFLRHHFTPASSNNFRAKLLHNSSILAFLGLFLGFQLFLRLLTSPALHILGFTSSVTIDEVVTLTNRERLSAGLAPLNYNEILADAARRKAANMFEENYWAHNSPSGLTPWYWFKQAGYHYVHAGENLGKDFGSTDRLVAAWMASPTHKENIVSPEYDEIGVAVVPGSLLGQETVLVVQLFGTTSGGSVPESSAPITTQTQGVSITPAIPLIAQAEPLPTPAPTLTPAASPLPQRYFSAFSLKQFAALITTFLFLLALFFDLVLAESGNFSRRVGKNWAHIIFLNVILILVTIVQAGRVL